MFAFKAFRQYLIQNRLRVLLLLQLGDVGGLEEPRPLLRDALWRDRHQTTVEDREAERGMPGFKRSRFVFSKKDSKCVD